MPLPNFLIVGAMRCGTTSLNGYLREHPEIAVSTPKEVHFFDMHYARGVDWYEQHFAETGGAVAVGEATPSYLYQPAAIERLHEMLPDARLIVMLRNPIDRAYSHYWHNKSRSRDPLDLAEAISAEPGRIASGGTDRHVFSYVDRGRYHQQLEYLFQRFPRDQVLVQTFESLNTDPQSVYRNTLAFLGVDPTFSPANLGVKLNAYVEFRSPKLRDIAKRLPGPLEALVGKLNQKPKQGYPPMAPAVRQQLAEIYARDNAGLSDLIGFETDWQ